MAEQPFRPRREDSSRREDKSPPSLAATAITLTVACAVFLGTCMGCIGPCVTNTRPDQQVNKPDPTPSASTPNESSTAPVDPPQDKPIDPAKPQSTLAGRMLVKRQYDSLLSFKDESQFRRFGLAPHRKWREESEAGRDNQEFSIRERVACADLLLLAMEYVTSKSEETKYTRWVRPEIEAVIEDKPPPFLADPAKKTIPLGGVQGVAA